MIRLGASIAILFQAILAAPVVAHEIRPAYLEMREKAPNEYSVLWKVPALGELRLGLYVRLPEACSAIAGSAKSIENGAHLERWTARCEGGLKGREITVAGLKSSMTDVLAHITYRDGTTETARLKPDAPIFVVAGPQTGLEVASTYFRLGVDHILAGIDHLLFVLALMLLIHSRRLLVKTITAFTAAHSITLAGASLGYFSLPQQPVEATIALSIAFVASELVRNRAGERRLSESYLWVVAFAFGLLHGLGFAGALQEIGLPQTSVPLALFHFNLGVEAGQLLFVTAVVSILWAARTFVPIPNGPARLTTAYMIGTLSMVWLVERLSGFVT